MIPDDSVVCSLCEAIDSGEDATLQVLADRLEEMGDAYAWGIRAIIVMGYVPRRRSVSDHLASPEWLAVDGVPTKPYHLSRPVILFMARHCGGSPFIADQYADDAQTLAVLFPRRSLAFFALAKALDGRIPN